MTNRKTVRIALAAAIALGGIVAQALASPAFQASISQTSTQKKKWGGSASCQAMCQGPNGSKVCRTLNAACGFTFDSEFAAKSYLQAQLNLQVLGVNGRVQGGYSFSLSFKYEF